VCVSDDERASEYNAKVKDWNLIRPIPHLWLSSVNVMKELKDREKSLDMESIRDVFGADANRETIIRHILQYNKNNQNNNWKTTGSSSGHGSHDMIYSVISKLIFKEQQQQDQAAKKSQSSSSSSSSCSKPPLLSSVQHNANMEPWRADQSGKLMLYACAPAGAFVLLGGGVVLFNTPWWVTL